MRKFKKGKEFTHSSMYIWASLYNPSRATLDNRAELVYKVI